MDTQNDKFPSNVYLFNSQTSNQELYDTVSKCLSQAEALVLFGSQCDMETMHEEYIDAYFWALSDIICQARYLHRKMDSKPSDIC